MNERDDVVLSRLAKLPVLSPPPALSGQLRERAHRALRPAPVHPLWSVAVAASVVLYLGWAVALTGRFF